MTTISEDTLRTQDLLPAFLEALNEVAPAHYEQLLVLPFGSIPAHAQEDEDSEWWDSEDAGWKLAELVDLLDEHAPEGTYFGAHEGDGACFGFWMVEEEQV